MTIFINNTIAPVLMSLIVCETVGKKVAIFILKIVAYNTISTPVTIPVITPYLLIKLFLEKLKNNAGANCTIKLYDMMFNIASASPPDKVKIKAVKEMKMMNNFEAISCCFSVAFGTMTL